MSQREFLVRLLDRFADAGVPYMIAGSFASSFHGEPRATNDLDVVIDPTESGLRAFVASLGSDYYVSPTAVEEALRLRSMFNVIDLENGWKADLILRKERAFSETEFGRRRAARLMDVDVFVSSPEDVILSKLEWAKVCGSERQLRDALGVAVAHFPDLDRPYLAQWGGELGVAAELAEVLHQAAEVRDPDASK